MYAIIGAGGKVGYATSKALRQANVPVRAILRSFAKAAQLQQIGCEVAVADLLDANSLAKAMQKAEAVQVIIPPSPQSKDGEQEMKDIIENVVTALVQTKPKKILAVSDYGSHVQSDIGMPTLFRGLE